MKRKEPQPTILLTPTPYQDLPPKKNEDLTGAIQEVLDTYVNFFRHLFNFFKNLLFNS